MGQHILGRIALQPKNYHPSSTRRIAKNGCEGESIITPSYPSMTRTLMGMAAVRRDSQRFQAACEAAPCPLKYQVVLETAGGLMVMGQVVTHLSIQDWCDWHNWNLLSVEGYPELAVSGEMTDLG